MPARAGTWLELGSGAGAFTLALARRLGAGAELRSVDRDADSLVRQRRALHDAGVTGAVHLERADIRGPWRWGAVDGVLAANVLHFITRTARRALLRDVLENLSPGGRLVVVEYDTTRASPWVPHPLPPRRLEEECLAAGFAACGETTRVTGSYGRPVYAAVATGARSA